MKDSAGVEKQTVISRQELYEDYVNYYKQIWFTEPQLCSDAQLGMKATQFLLREPEPRERFTTFPFYQAVMEGGEKLNKEWRKHLTALIKATEILERLCVNLFLQPWKKEFKTLKHQSLWSSGALTNWQLGLSSHCASEKAPQGATDTTRVSPTSDPTFTGPFVYCLLPVLSTSTIESVLASIGYLPHTDTQHSQYSLREDANPNTAMLVGFELLLARVECCHLLKLLEQDQPGLQEWVEILLRRAGHHKMQPVENVTAGQEEEEDMKKEEERKMEGELSQSLAHQGVKEVEKKENLGAKQWEQGSQLPLSLEAKAAVKPQPKPRRSHILIEDKSIMEMQRNYPDLAIRGRPLIQDKTQRASSSRNSTTAAQILSKNNDTNNDSNSGTPVYSDYNKSTTIGSKSDCSKACDIFDIDSRSSSNSSNCSNISVSSDSKIISNTSTQGSSVNSSNNDGSTSDDGLSGPQAISMHITLRAGTRSDQSLRPGQPQPNAELPPCTDHQAAEGLQNIRPAKAEPPSLRSMDKEQEVNELAEKMGWLHVQETGEDRRKKEEEKRDKERRKQERKANESEEEEIQDLQKLRKPVEERNPSPVVLSHFTSRSSQLDSGVLKEQKQSILCHPSLLTTCNIPDCHTCKGGADMEGGEGEKRSERDGERAERAEGEDEHLAQSYVIVEHHNK